MRTRPTTGDPKPDDMILGVVAVVRDDVTDFAWVFDTSDGSVRRDHGASADYTIAGNVSDLIAMVENHENVRALLRSGQIRVRRTRDSDSGASLAHTMNVILALLRREPPAPTRPETLT